MRVNLVMGGCDCPTCKAGDDRWCCRTCHNIARDDQPCERCAFIPTPDGKCICREVGK